MGGTADPRAAGLAEAHAEVVLKVLKMAPGSEYTGFLKRKLVEWYQAAQKSDWHAPSQEERGEEIDEEWEAEERGASAVCATRCLIWLGKPLKSDFDAEEDRQT